MTVKLPNLPDWEVLDVKEDARSYRIRARYTKPPAYCPGCGVADPGVQRFGKRENVFADLPHHGKRTEIVVDRQRYRCRDCGSSFLEPLPQMDEHHDAIRRMAIWVEQQTLRRPFSQVARDVELSESRCGASSSSSSSARMPATSRVHPYLARHRRGIPARAAAGRVHEPEAPVRDRHAARPEQGARHQLPAAPGGCAA